MKTIQDHGMLVLAFFSSYFSKRGSKQIDFTEVTIVKIGIVWKESIIKFE